MKNIFKKIYKYSLYFLPLVIYFIIKMIISKFFSTSKEIKTENITNVKIKEEEIIETHISGSLEIEQPNIKSVMKIKRMKDIITELNK